MPGRTQRDRDERVLPAADRGQQLGGGRGAAGRRQGHEAGTRGWISITARPAHGARATSRPCRTPSPVVSRSDVAPQTVCAEVTTSPARASTIAPELRTRWSPMRGVDGHHAEAEVGRRGGGRDRDPVASCAQQRGLQRPGPWPSRSRQGVARCDSIPGRKASGRHVAGVTRYGGERRSDHAAAARGACCGWPWRPARWPSRSPRRSSSSRSTADDDAAAPLRPARPADQRGRHAGRRVGRRTEPGRDPPARSGLRAARRAPADGRRPVAAGRRRGEPVGGRHGARRARPDPARSAADVPRDPRGGRRDRRRRRRGRGLGAQLARGPGAGDRAGRAPGARARGRRRRRGPGSRRRLGGRGRRRAAAP